MMVAPLLFLTVAVTACVDCSTSIVTGPVGVISTDAGVVLLPLFPPLLVLPPLVSVFVDVVDDPHPATSTRMATRRNTGAYRRNTMYLVARPTHDQYRHATSRSTPWGSRV